jgi:hypothetical protein
MHSTNSVLMFCDLCNLNPGGTEFTKFHYISQFVSFDLDRLCMSLSQIGERRRAYKT